MQKTFQIFFYNTVFICTLLFPGQFLSNIRTPKDCRVRNIYLANVDSKFENVLNNLGLKECRVYHKFIKILFCLSFSHIYLYIFADSTKHHCVTFRKGML
jgi:hypothetical protein